MKIIQNLFIKLCALSVLFFLPVTVFAGNAFGTMTVELVTTAVPTLSNIMLVILSLLLFAIAFRVAKQNNTSVNKMFITLLGVGSLSLLTGGVQLVSKAKADAGVGTGLLVISLDAGESSKTIPFFSPINNFVSESTNQTLLIRDISINSGLAVCGSPSEAGVEGVTANKICRVGESLSPNEECTLFCREIDIAN